MSYLFRCVNCRCYFLYRHVVPPIYCICFVNYTIYRKNIKYIIIEKWKIGIEKRWTWLDNKL